MGIYAKLHMPLGMNASNKPYDIYEREEETLPNILK